MITAQEVNDWINSPIPKSIEQIENRINNLLVGDLVEIHIVGNSNFRLFSIALFREDLMTKRGTMRENVAKLIRPVLSSAERIDVLGFAVHSKIASTGKP